MQILLYIIEIYKVRKTEKIFLGRQYQRIKWRMIIEECSMKLISIQNTGKVCLANIRKPLRASTG